MYYMKFSMNNGETSGKITELKKKKGRVALFVHPCHKYLAGYSRIPGY